MKSITKPTWLEDRAQEHLKFLAEQLGPRPPASDNYHAASKYITQVFRNCGLVVELQEWECPNWMDISTQLVMDNTELTVAANAYSQPCDITAPFEVIRTMKELELAELEGKIAVLCADLTMHPLSPKSWFLVSERELQMISLLEKKSPSAIITVQSNPGNLERLIEDAEFSIPSAVVPADVGRQLLDHRRKPVHLRISTKKRTRARQESGSAKLRRYCASSGFMCAL